MNRAIGILLALVLSACGQQLESEVSIFEMAVASVERPDADRARDAGRKPADVLEFLGIARGMTVLDMFSGGGYYTEILSGVVGDDGHVIAHSNKAYLNFLAELHSGLKTGGIVAVIDHFAAAGSPSETGGTTHRIDAAIVIDTMTAAGFVLEGQSDILRNPDDDYEKIVFDAELRGKTDRFIMRFVKAE